MNTQTAKLIGVIILFCGGLGGGGLESCINQQGEGNSAVYNVHVQYKLCVTNLTLNPLIVQPVDLH